MDRQHFPQTRRVRPRRPQLNASHSWLSHPLRGRRPIAARDPAPELSDLYTIARDGARVHMRAVLANHTGTHLERPRPCHRRGWPEHSQIRAGRADLPRRPALLELRMPAAEVVEPRDLVGTVEDLGDPDLLLGALRLHGELRRHAIRICLLHPLPRLRGLPRRAGCARRFPSLPTRAIGLGDVPSIACIAHLDETMRALTMKLLGEARAPLPHHRRHASGGRYRRPERGLRVAVAGAGHGQRTLRGCRSRWGVACTRALVGCRERLTPTDGVAPRKGDLA